MWYTRGSVKVRPLSTTLYVRSPCELRILTVGGFFYTGTGLGILDTNTGMTLFPETSTVIPFLELNSNRT